MGAGTLNDLLEDALEMHDLAVELLHDKEDPELPLEDSLGYAAYTRLDEVANKLSGTPLAKLKREGVKTSLTEGKLFAVSHSHLD